MSKFISKNSCGFKPLKQPFVLFCLVATSLLAVTGHVNAAVLARDLDLNLPVPISLGGANLQPGVTVGIAISDSPYQSANSVLRDTVQIASTSQPISTTFDTNLSLGGSGFVGTASAEARSDFTSVEMAITQVDYQAVGYGSILSTNSVAYQTVRFDSPEDKAIVVDASYLLTGSVTRGLDSLPGYTYALSALQIFDWDSFSPTQERDGFVYGDTRVGLLDLVRTEGVETSPVAAESFNALTNREYLVIFGVAAQIDIKATVETSVNLLITATATAPVFSVVDANVSIVQSRFDTTPSTVPEPSIFMLLGLGLVGLGWKRRNRVS